MSNLQIIFATKNAADDEKIWIERTDKGYVVKYSTPLHKKKQAEFLLNLSRQKDVYDYVLNILTLVVYDSEPGIGVQFFFPASPSVLYTYETLKKDEVWNQILDTLEFWLDQETWPTRVVVPISPVSPILLPVDLTKDDKTEVIDLSESGLKIEVDDKNQQRNVTVLPRLHTFFDEDGCPCSRVSRSSR